MKNINPLITRVISGSLLLFSFACKNFVEIEPPADQIVNEKIFSNDENATSAIRGIYAKMMTSAGFASGSSNSVMLLAGRSADEFINFHSSDNYKQFYTNGLLPTNSSLRSGLWQDPYQCIYSANLIIENLERSSEITTSVKNQLEGEAKFIRAFCHFYLTNLFGEIPLILTSDYRINAVASASAKPAIYAKIIEDLKEAKNLLTDNYPSVERIRPNKWAAAALLSRVYLYNKDWANAEIQATEVIAQKGSYNLIIDDLNKVFLKNSQEAIFQLVVPTALGTNAYEGNFLILTAAPGAGTPVILTNELVAAFEPGDLRLSKWVGTFTSGSASWRYAFKYKNRISTTPLTEYSMVLRIAEQYLIRAEAQINQPGKLAAGINDLNTLRARARSVATPIVPNPLPAISTSITKENALLAVEHERRIELFAEWGHRWLDLKRTERADIVLGPQKLLNWQSTDVLYPIPATEIINNVNLKQNKGYE